LAIKGVFEANQSKGKHIITVCTEHKAVLDTCQHLEKYGAELSILEVDKQGKIDISALEAAIRPQTILVSAMVANNETGVLHPLQEIAEICQKYKILFHTDATQAIGKMNINVNTTPIDLLSLSGHKIYAPKGVGVLYIRQKTPLTAQQDGGKHERNRRSGTLNVTGIVGIGHACQIAQEVMFEENQRLKALRDKLENEIMSQLPDCQINGDIMQRLPNITNISFGGLDGEQLLMRLNQIAISNGSACNSASTEPSYVLKALCIDDDLAYSSIRFSVGRFTTETEINKAIRHITETAEKMKEFGSL
jgi:cysteine desulfurase